MFLDKYKNKKRLGKGAYGDVYLVEDQDGTLFALKLIQVKMIEAEPHLREYLDGEIQCMKTMNSPYITKLYDVKEDQSYIYLVLEYCDGGDLVNCQAKLKDKVFPLDRSTEALAEVIIGLQTLHQEGYLHRDIKSQNVLIKNQNGKDHYKLADFGFTKKKADVGGTILGTEQFMSPEIFQGNQSIFYGFEVDMWAFGVLFYFMLNMEFPFKLNPHWQPERKEVELKKMATKFIFSNAVKASKKQKTENCTPEMDDLFSRMFDTDPDNRITFSDIRRHPVFAKHFPVVAEASKILYSKKFQPSKIVKNPNAKKYADKKDINEQDNIRTTISIIRKKNQNFPEEKEVLERKKDEIDFLKDNSEVFYECVDFLKPHERLMLSYNVLKYYIVLLRKLKDLLNKDALNKQYPNMKWNQYVGTKEFKEMVQEVNDDLCQNEIKFVTLFDECEEILNEIGSINPKFKNAFDRDITETEFENEFKESYRKSTIYIFGVLREALKNKTRKGNKLNYIMALVVISHAFNNIFSDIENLREIFKEYVEDRKKPVDKMNFGDLRQWMSKSKEAILNNIAKTIIKIYFQG